MERRYEPAAVMPDHSWLPKLWGVAGVLSLCVMCVHCILLEGGIVNGGIGRRDNANSTSSGQKERIKCEGNLYYDMRVRVNKITCKCTPKQPYIHIMGCGYGLAVNPVLE